MLKTHIIIMKHSPLNVCCSRYGEENGCNYELGFLHKNLISFLRVNFLTVYIRKSKKTH